MPDRYLTGHFHLMLEVNGMSVSVAEDYILPSTYSVSFPSIFT